MSPGDTVSAHATLPCSLMAPGRRSRVTCSNSGCCGRVGCLPILAIAAIRSAPSPRPAASRSEEHTSELQSHVNLVCRLLLEKKKQKHRRLDAEVVTARALDAADLVAVRREIHVKRVYVALRHPLLQQARQHCFPDLLSPPPA